MSSHFFPQGLPVKAGSRAARATTASERIRAKFKWFEGDGRLGETLSRDIDLSASTNINVLIVGETGTGKEVIAQWIHAERKVQQRLSEDESPFVAVNCAAIPENLVESILFGHERGAFTSARMAQKGKFEIAKRGTLFLDEIQNLNLGAQSKLLRAVQSREFERLGAQSSDAVQCQIVTATNVPLELLVEKNHFRKDLYYRLNICPIYLPALRHRKEDLPSLIKHYLKRVCTEHHLSPKDLTPEAFEVLLNHPWPGNLRELEHCLLYAALRSPEEICVDNLPATLTGNMDIYLKNGIWGLA